MQKKVQVSKEFLCKMKKSARLKHIDKILDVHKFVQCKIYHKRNTNHFV